MNTVFRLGAALRNFQEENYYSSAKFYHTGIHEFGMLTHC